MSSPSLWHHLGIEKVIHEVGTSHQCLASIPLVQQINSFARVQTLFATRALMFTNMQLFTGVGIMLFAFVETEKQIRMHLFRKT